MDDRLNHDLDDEFAAWTILKDGVWEAKTPAIAVNQPEYDNSIISYDVVLPQALVEDDLISKKLSHHRYMQCDVEIELKVNSTPTQSGLLFMTMLPFTAVNPPDSRWIRGNVLDTGYPSITALPGVYLNLEDTTTARLTIPWKHPLNSFDMLPNADKPTQALGTLMIYPIAPLLGPTDSESAYFTVYGRLRNVKLFAPCENPEPTTYKKVQTTSDFHVQIGEMNGWSLADIAASTVKAATSAIGVPVMNRVAKAVSWFPRMMGNNSAAAGYAKPSIQSAPNFVVRQPLYGAQHVQGYMASQNLGSVQDNEVANILEGEDEMDIKKFSSRDSVLDVLSFDISSAELNKHNVVIFSTPVCPNPTQLFDSKDKSIAGSPLTFLASLFAYWRGGLTYKFRFVKTKFHQGRLRATFLPGAFDVATKSTAPALNRCYSTIIDLSSQSEVTFTVPFTCNHEWLETSLTAKKSALDTILWTERNTTGTLILSILNPIIAPDSVSKKMHIVTSVSSSDMQLAQPVMTCVNVIDYDPPTPPPPPSMEIEYAEEAMEEDEVDGWRVQIGETPNPISNTPNDTVTTRTMGEAITNLRLLTHKLQKFTAKGPEAADNQRLFSANEFAYNNPVLRAFCLWRGSVRIVPGGSAITNMRDLQYSADSNFTSFVNDGGSGVVPFYCDVPFQLCRPIAGVFAKGLDKRNAVIGVTNSANATTPRWYAGGDDFTAAVYAPIGRVQVLCTE
nr:TPA_asm: structural polyprotein [Procofluvi virus]